MSTRAPLRIVAVSLIAALIAGATLAQEAPLDQPFFHVAKLNPFWDLVENGPRFGSSVAMQGDTMVVGAWREDFLGADSGAAYVFVRADGQWWLQAKLVPLDGAAGDRFGTSVAVDGLTIVVGASRDTNDIGVNAGAAYVFSLPASSSDWVQMAKLTAADGATEDYFGTSVAVDGETVVVGAYKHDLPATECGAAYVFAWSGSGWSLQQKLSSDDIQGYDWLGAAVALEGDTAVIGAPYDDHAAGNQAGSAYVFTRSGTTWSQQQRLFADDATGGEQLGVSVAISHDTVIAGAYADGLPGVENQGSAYVFVRSGSIWSQQSKLEDAAPGEDDYFGFSVAVDGDTAVVGAPYDDDVTSDAGAASVFLRAGTSWSLQQKLLWDWGADSFAGWSVAVSGDTVALGTYADDHMGGIDSGSVGVWNRIATLWTMDQLLVASDPVDCETGQAVALQGDTMVVGQPLVCYPPGGPEDERAFVFQRAERFWIHQWTFVESSSHRRFGSAVAIDGDTIVVGADACSFDPDPALGWVNAYARSGTAWVQQGDRIRGHDTVIGDCFGAAVAVDGDTLAVAAPNSSRYAQSTAVYVFVRSGATWTEQAKIVPPGTALFDKVGFSVSLDGETLLIGAPGTDSDAGAVYVFTRSGTTWTLQQELVRPDIQADQLYGASVALDGDTAVVGMPRAGVAFVFTRSGATWSQQQMLVPSDSAVDFGASSAVDGETIVIGTRFTKEYYMNQGEVEAAYVFTRSGVVWSEQQRLISDQPDDTFSCSIAADDDRIAVGAMRNEFPELPDWYTEGATFVFEREAAPPLLIFSDGFESGGTSAWSATVPMGVGAAVIPLDPATTVYHAEFWFDPALGEALGAGPVTALVGLGPGQERVFSIDLRRHGGATELRARSWGGRGRSLTSEWTRVGSDPRWLLIDWRASLEGRSDGQVLVRVDGSLLVEIEGLANDGSALGAVVAAVVDGRPLIRVTTDG